MKTEKIANTTIEIKPIELCTTSIRIRGTSPLIVHNWSHKAKQEILDTQTGIKKTKKKHDYKLPSYDFCESLYWLDGKPEYDEEHLYSMSKQEDADAYVWKLYEEAISKPHRFGFPVTAIKNAAVMAASRNDLAVKSTWLKGAFFIKGEGKDMCAEIKGPDPVIREDMVRVGGISKTADIRFRPQFNDWYMDIEVTYNKNGPVTLEQIVNLINLGGFTCGLGEWRMEKNGNYGTYMVEPMG